MNKEFVPKSNRYLTLAWMLIFTGATCAITLKYFGVIAVVITVSVLLILSFIHLIRGKSVMVKLNDDHLSTRKGFLEKEQKIMYREMDNILLESSGKAIVLSMSESCSVKSVRLSLKTIRKEERVVFFDMISDRITETML